MPTPPLLVYGPASTDLAGGRPAGLLGIALRLAALGTPVRYLTAAATDPKTLDEPGGVVLGTETFAHGKGRTVSQSAGKLALRSGIPVVLHIGPTDEGGPWAGEVDPLSVTRALAARSTLVVAGEAEATALTGAAGPEAAAAALAAAGATIAVVLGDGLTALDGPLRARADGAPAGWALTAGLTARLAASRWYPAAAAAALPHLCATP